MRTFKTTTSIALTLAVLTVGGSFASAQQVEARQLVGLGLGVLQQALGSQAQPGLQGARPHSGWFTPQPNHRYPQAGHYPVAGRQGRRNLPRIRNLKPKAKVQDLSGRRGDESIFRIEVPANTRRFVVQTANGSGDVDLFLERGSFPEPGRAEFSSATRGNREEITIDNPRAGTWFLLVYGYEQYRRVDLRTRVTLQRHRGRLQLRAPRQGETWFLGGEQVIAWQASRNVDRVQIQFSLDNGQTWRRTGLPFALDADDGQYVVDIPARQQFLTDAARIRIVDVDNPATSVTSRPFRIAEPYRPVPRPVPYPTPWPGRGQPTCPHGRLQDDCNACDHDHGWDPRDRRDQPRWRDDVRTLRPGRTVRDLEGDRGEDRLFRVFVPRGARTLQVMTAGDEGDLGLIVKRQGAPGRWRTGGRGTLHTLTLRRPAPGWYLIRLQANDEYEDVQIAAAVNSR